jgi:hypothetical protein
MTLRPATWHASLQVAAHTYGAASSGAGTYLTQTIP